MFIVLEGIDGSGKSTQARLLAESLRARRRLGVLLVREPGGTRLGERLRDLVLDPKSGDLAPETELFLFMAARAHLVRTRIRPALDVGQVVVSDRFLWSSVVYQGLAVGQPAAEILRMGRMALDGVRPTRIIIVDVDPKVALARVRNSNRMEGRGIEFQRRVRRGFLRLAGEFRRTAVVVDGRGTPEEVHARILESLPVRGWPRSSSR
jgi:dTMP kinase